MTQILARWTLALAALLLALPAARAAAPGDGPLVTAAWVRDNLSRPDLLVIDASPARMHAAGHIPGAVNADVFSFGGNPGTTADMEKRIQSWGVDPSKKVVIYDQGGTYFATSLLWDLHHYGFPADRVAVLDGGMAKWQEVGGAVTKEATPAPRPGGFRAEVREEIRVRLPEFLVASGDPSSHALVEALDPAQHFGGAKFFDRPGHVPNAIMMPTSDFFNADKTFKSPEEIRRMFTYLGIRTEQKILSHCGGGIAASVPYFAAKVVLGYPDVKLYKESQLEWLRDDRGLPFWTYDAPQLTRDRNWLNGWGNQMMRGFGVAKLSVVDVRAEPAFKQARVPYAINVPAEVFRNNIRTPARLAEALGAAGVDVSQEAVVVSDGGLNPDSALAFLMLESLGQKRVSLLTDSVDEWGFAGLPLEKESDAADPKRVPRSRFITPKPYTAEPRRGILIGDAQQSRGLYPKVYVASGKSLPAKLPQGKVVHVPYTDLVDAKGAPKPAKDIWNALVKAGVPRYAELVSFADDPGEAAANYFVLKLMGYPDVKVLVL